MLSANRGSTADVTNADTDQDSDQIDFPPIWIIRNQK